MDTVYTGSPQLFFLNLELFFHLFSWICDDSIAPQIQRLHHRRSDAHCSLRLEAIECRIIRENFLIESIASQIHHFESILLKTTQSTMLEKINLISVLCWANMVLWISLSARLPPPCVCCAMPRRKRKPRMDARAHGPGFRQRERTSLVPPGLSLCSLGRCHLPAEGYREQRVRFIAWVTMLRDSAVSCCT